MRALLGYLLLITIASAQPTKFRFDGRDLVRVDNREEAAAGIRTYRDSSADTKGPSYELGIVRIQNAPGDWPTMRESFLRVVRKKASLLGAVVRGDPEGDFVVVDFAYLRPDGVTFEYAILRHSLNAKGELVTVDVRLRFPAARNDLATRVEKDRALLVSEFTQLAAEVMK
jgi:hypothetical protein